MDAKALFQAVSRRMHADFEVSGQIRHSGSKGAVRENALRKFLENGRLPEKYAVGSGEVVERVRDTSRQCDLIIYDRMKGISGLRRHLAGLPHRLSLRDRRGEVRALQGQTDRQLGQDRSLKDMAPGGVQIETMGAFTSPSPGSPRSASCSPMVDQVLGLGDLGAFITLPIGPRHLLIAANRRSTINAHAHAAAPHRRVVVERNRLTVARARDYVWARDRGQAEFIGKTFGADLVPTLWERLAADAPDADTMG